MYAFWRLFDVVKGKLVRKQKEQFIALSGTGWSHHAKYAEECAKHAEYCKRTLLAYMPCPGLEGTSYIVTAVREHFQNCWPLALWEFVMDPKQRWCPTWIVRNYEVQNNVIHGLPVLSALPKPRPHDTDPEPADGEVPPFPHAKAYRMKFTFERSGEPNANEPADPDDPTENFAPEDQWTQSERPGWPSAQLTWSKYSSRRPFTACIAA